MYMRAPLHWKLAPKLIMMVNLMTGNGNGRKVDAVIFDFGGVLAEEGFFNGFKAIAKRHGMDPGGVAETAVDVIRGEGYVEGRTSEAMFWDEFRQRTGIALSDEELRDEVLSGFVLRDWMFAAVDKLKKAGYKVAILSDQTNWLEELDAEHGIYGRFDLVLNSFRIGRTKKDPSLFDEVVLALGTEPGRTLFVDDFDGHIRRAEGRGLKAIHYTGRESFERQFSKYCPDV